MSNKAIILIICLILVVLSAIIGSECFAQDVTDRYIPSGSVIKCKTIDWVSYKVSVMSSSKQGKSQLKPELTLRALSVTAPRESQNPEAWSLSTAYLESYGCEISVEMSSYFPSGRLIGKAVSMHCSGTGDTYRINGYVSDTLDGQMGIPPYIKDGYSIIRDEYPVSVNIIEGFSIKQQAAEE